MPKISLRYAWDMAETWLRYPWDSLRYTQDIPEICLKYVWDILEIFLNMAKISLRYLWDMPEMCLGYARDITEMCLTSRDRDLDTDMWFPSLSVSDSVSDRVDPWDAYASKKWPILDPKIEDLSIEINQNFFGFFFAHPLSYPILTSMKLHDCEAIEIEIWKYQESFNRSWKCQGSSENLLRNYIETFWKLFRNCR